MDVIRQGTTIGMSQDGDGVDRIFIDALPTMVERGVVCLYHEGKVVFMLRRRTAHVGLVDIFLGEGATVFDAIRVGRRAIQWAAENTHYHKLEARSPYPMMRVLALRIGWKVEGYREQSYRAEDGRMLDEIEVGLILRSESCRKSH